MKKFRVMLVAIMFAVMAVFVSPGTANAATTGNIVCVTTNSTLGAWVDALYSGWRATVNRGYCKSGNVQGFAVPMSWHCVSQWGYTYPGDMFGKAYYFKTNNNTLRLTCYRS